MAAGRHAGSGHRRTGVVAAAEQGNRFTIMIGLPLLVAATLQADSLRVCVRDQETDAPLLGVSVTSLSSAPIRTRMLAANCAWVPAGRTEFRRIGYRAVVTDVRGEIIIRLAPLVGARTVLDTQHVVASMGASDASRTVATLSAADGRTRGASTIPQLVSMLPYTQLQSNRGAVALSLRGARREQVVVTLDGVPLNDPSTGLADIAELPLSMIAGASLSPGASQIVDGSGAIGGVLALQSSNAPMLTVRSGAFGEVAGEAAGRIVGAGMIGHLGASWSERRNDFRFRNTAGAFETPPDEVRVNNDERKLAVSGSVLRSSMRLAASASRTERGMVGPMNVRTYDHDRARVDRFLVDSRFQYRALQAFANLRSFALAYRDVTRPPLNSDAHANVVSLGVNAVFEPVTVSASGGADRVTASNGVRQDRARGQVAVHGQHRVGSAIITGGARVDAVEHSGILPSFSLGITQEWRRDARNGVLQPVVRARVAQAVRVPTLYDLYFASPQRLVVRTLDPERVVYDGELSAGIAWRRGEHSIMLEGAAIARELRDAIIWFPGNFSWSPANVGQEQLRGVEFRAQGHSGPAQLSAWTSWYDASLTSSNLVIPTPYVARQSGGAQFATDLRAFTVSSALRVLGRRPFTNGPRNPLYELPAVSLVDAAVAHRTSLFGTSLLIAASLENILDRSWQSVHGFPEPGRRWSLSLTLTPRH